MFRSRQPSELDEFDSSFNPFQNHSRVEGSLAGATTRSSYIVPEEDGMFIEVEEAQVVSENTAKIGGMSILQNSYIEKDDLHSNIKRDSIGTFTEQRAEGDLEQFEELVQNNLDHKLKKPSTSKRKRLLDVTFVEVGVEDSGDIGPGNPSFGKYQGEGGIPLAPAVENQMIMLMKKAGKYRGTIDKLEDKLKEAIVMRKKLEEELESTKNELDVAKLVTGGGGDDWRRGLNTVSGTNANAQQAAALARQKREEERRKMFSGLADDEEEGLSFGDDNNRNVFKRIVLGVKRWWKRNQPFGRDLLMVESRFGNSVAAYFIFFRWLFVNAMILFALQGIFMFYHVGNLYVNGMPYIANGTDTVVMKKVPWASFQGTVPKWMLFSSYSPVEGVQYAAIMFLSQIVLILFTIQKTVAEDRKKKVFDQVTGNSKVWTKLTLNAWDHSHTDTSAFADQSYHTGEAISVKILEEKTAGALQSRTAKEKYMLYAKRIVLFLLYMVLQISGWFVIIYLTANNKMLQESVTKAVGQQVPLDIVPVAVSIINALLPAIITKLVELEKWDSQGDFIKQKTTKIFMAKTFNVLIQLFSYASLLNPYFFSQDELFFGLAQTYIRENTEKAFDIGTFQCRADQTGTQIFGLVVTEFVMGKLLGIGVPLAMYLVSKMRQKAWKKSEFDVALKMIGLLYFQQLALMAPVFLPVGGIIALLFFYINFKFDIFVLAKTQAKPKKPWSAKDAGKFFLKFYIFSIGISLAANHVILEMQTQPKLCEKQITDIPLDQVTKLPKIYEPTTACAAWASQNPSGAVTINGESVVLSEAFPVHWCACARPCGPYINGTSMYEPVVELLGKYEATATILNVITKNVIVIWALVVAITVNYFFLNNSYTVTREAHADRAAEWQGASQTLQRRIKKLEKKVALHEKMQTGAS